MQQRWISLALVAGAMSLLLATSMTLGCGGGGGGTGPTPTPAPTPTPTPTPTPVIGVTVTPPSTEVVPAQTTTFSAIVSGTSNQQVLWSILEGLAGGIISDSGVYTAPGLAGTFHVVATSRADLTKNAVATITVRVVVIPNPSTVTLTLRETRQLSASVTGSQNQGISWSIQEGAAGGTVSPGGLYTAPATPGIFHALATSMADPQRSASITITVQAGSASGTIQ